MDQDNDQSPFTENNKQDRSTEPPLTPEYVNKTSEVFPEPEIDVPAWERRHELGFLKSIVDTLNDVLANPTRTFRKMKKSGGLAVPLTYGWIMGIVLGCAETIISHLLTMKSDEFVRQMYPREVLELFPMLLEQSLSSKLLQLIAFVTIGLFIAPAVMHICLWLLGAKKYPYEATFRLYSYTVGSIALIKVFPFCGEPVRLIWQFVILVIALKQVHQTTTAKAVMALLPPLIACCLADDAYVMFALTNL